jgi:hypothetical protein
MASACDQNNGIERSADNVIRIPLPEEPPIACVRVQSGDTVILPFDLSDHSTFRMQSVDGFLVIEKDDATIFMQGWGQASEIVVIGSDGVPFDVPLFIAVTEPYLDFH